MHTVTPGGNVTNRPSSADIESALLAWLRDPSSTPPPIVGDTYARMLERGDFATEASE